MSSKHKVDTSTFMTTDDAHTALSMMLSDDSFKTEAGYAEDEILYPDHHAPFVEKHMSYLKNHPKVNPKDYLSNLRIMTKIRR